MVPPLIRRMRQTSTAGADFPQGLAELLSCANHLSSTIFKARRVENLRVRPDAAMIGRDRKWRIMALKPSAFSSKMPMPPGDMGSQATEPRVAVRRGSRQGNRWPALR